MAINKNFVVKNGIEVNTNQIFADATTGKVGIDLRSPELYLTFKAVQQPQML